MMTFYAGPDEHGGVPEHVLNPLLRPALSGTDRAADGRPLPRRVATLDEADVVALPKVWSEYARRRTPAAESLAAQAETAGKPLVVWHTGDLNPIVTSRNAVVMVSAVERSRRRPNWHVAPRFLADPLPIHAGGQLVVRHKSMTPRIGFCGFAATGRAKLIYSVLSNVKFRAESWLGSAPYEPPPIVPATLLRAKVLDALARSRGVHVEFIVRQRYKAGAYAAGPEHWSVREFYANILSTDYTVCVRGYGNWSIRFYETLACGRIPILIDTDCSLPFDRAIDWRQLCVWVPAADAARTAEYVARFHDALSDEQFRQRQRECRNVWKTRLTLPGFLSHFGEHLAALIPERCAS